jgi:hypothetical protein
MCIFGVKLIKINLIYVPDDEGEYFTPPSTPRKLSSSESLVCCEGADSDDDGTASMSTPDEGPDVFIQG